MISTNKKFKIIFHGILVITLIFLISYFLEAPDLFVKEVDQSVHKIDQDQKNYHPKSEPMMGLSTEGGDRVCYYYQDRLRKVTITLYGEMGRFIANYYFADDQLIYIFTTHFDYDKPFYVKGFKVKTIQNDYYYFRRGNLIRWVKSGGEVVKSTSEDFLKEQQEISEFVRKNISSCFSKYK